MSNYVHAPNRRQRYSVSREGENLIVGPGDRLAVPPGAKHSFENVGDSETRGCGPRSARR